MLTILAVLILSQAPAAPATAAPSQPAPRPVLSPGVSEKPAPTAAGAESIGSLLAAPAAAQAEPSGAGGLFFRMLGWVAALGLVSLAGASIWKRLAPGRASRLDAGGLRVVSRTALTAKHAIYGVRAGPQRLLLVGISGDRMTLLAQFEDPAQVMAVDSSFARALEREGAAHDGSGGLDQRGMDQLLPYQREVQRLRDLVRGWRSRLRRAPGREVEAAS